jgi:RecA/RadA recombinase
VGLALTVSASPPGPTFLTELDEEMLIARPHPGGSTLQRGDMLEIIGPSGSGESSSHNTSFKILFFIVLSAAC